MANVNAFVLQLAVGTANIQGTAGLNVLATFRQPNGKSVLLDTPAVTGPFKLPAAAGTPDGNLSTIETGPGPTEVGTSTMTGTAQTATSPSTFGLSGEVAGLGIEPFNSTNGGTPYSYVPFTLPLYDTNAKDPNAFVPWGGPPAFDYLGNGHSPVGSAVPGGVSGVSEGLDVFVLAPVAGPYTLTASVPGNTGTVNKTASATLATTALLPTVGALPVPTADGNGGATFAVTLPAGVTQAFLQITDSGPAKNASCNGSSAAGPVYYTVLVTASGAATLPDAAGPGGAPSLCTPTQNTAANTDPKTMVATPTDGDGFSAQVIGFDYDMFSLEYSSPTAVKNAKAAPAFPAQADVTISALQNFTWPNGGVLMSSARRTLTQTTHF
ncbi:MAG: hypothetical protein ACREQ5_11265 [Candidatus Dormibacteria bacterium]